MTSAKRVRSKPASADKFSDRALKPATAATALTAGTAGTAGAASTSAAAAADRPAARFDRQDLAILRELLLDSRKTLQEIGAAVKLSPTTCWSRIKRLEAEGVITKYSVEVDRARLGYRDTVIVQLTLESHTDETLYEFGRLLAEIPEVMDASLVSGDYDYLIRIAVKDTRDYERLLREKLYKIPGIRHSKSSFVLRVLKDENVPVV